MTESCSEGLLGTWAVPECPFTISYSLRALDDIRLAVTDAFFSLPRGGAEIGGILLGKRDPSQVVVLDFLALDCEHAFGPSFTLSPKDLAHLSVLLESARKNSPDLQPVGWYHSHTRSEIFLSEADLEIHRRYFVAPWQIALVLKPHTFQPTRAGFFFREADGSFRIENSYQEFVLDPLPMRQLPGEHAPLPMAGGSFRLDPVPTANVVAMPAADPPLHTNGVPAPPEIPGVSGAEPPEAETEPEPPTEVPAETTPPEISVNFPDLDRRPHWRTTAILGIAALLAVAGVAYQTRDAWMPHSWRGEAAVPAGVANRLGLALIDHDGDLQISWGRKTRAVLSASRGTLEIAGAGGIPTAVPLTPSQLQTGSFTYKRESDKIEVVLSIENASGETGRESANFMGRLPEHARQQVQAVSEATLQQERNKLSVEVERLKGDLKAELARNQQLLKYMDQKSDVVAEAERLRNQLNALTARNKDLEKAAKPKDDQLAKLQIELNKQKSFNHVLAQSLDEAQAQLKLQQKKRLTNQDTAKQ